MEMVRIFVTMVAVILMASPVAAHERRSVAGNDLVVGFLNEPAFSGQMNGMDVCVKRAGEPVEGLENSLKASVSYGSEGGAFATELSKRHGKPGCYAVYFLPTRSGSYRFLIHGDIKGVPVSETFSSGPDTFGDVRDSESLRFP